MFIIARAFPVNVFPKRPLFLDFETILKAEFLQNYELIEEMDSEFIDYLRNWHNEIKTAANSLYDIEI